MFRTHAALLASILFACLLAGLAFHGIAAAQSIAAPVREAAVDPLAGGTIAAIKVEGNQRIEDSTILSYMLLQPGDPFDADKLDRSLKTLYATGLFSDVSLRRDGDTLVVTVKENPIVNRQHA